MKLNKHLITKVLLLLLILLIPSMAAYGASLKVRYNGKTTTYKGKQISATFDGKTIDMKKMPGILVSGTSMVSAYNVFKKGVGANYSYSSATKTITISQYDVTIKLFVGKKTAYINNKKVTAPVAPFYTKYYNTGSTVVMVPAEFVAKALGYGYTWTNQSSTTLLVKMTTPFQIQYNDQWNTYKGTQGKVSVDEKSINVSRMPSVIMNNTTLVQARTVFSVSSIDAYYKYDANNNTVTIKKDDVTIIYTLGTKIAKVNGEEITLSTEPLLMKSNLNKSSYVMVPGEFTAKTLGYEYYWDGSKKTSVISTPEEDKIYFSWEQQKNETDLEGQISDAAVNPPEKNGVSIVNIISGYKNGTDYITFTATGKLNHKIFSDPQYIYLDFLDTSNGVGDNMAAIDEVNCLKHVSVYTSQENSVSVVIEKIESATYKMEENDTQVTLILENGGDEESNQDNDDISNPSGKNNIKIAIDVGHGLNTGGKRTPPMPVDVDFEGDGVIDIQKGTTIREFVANVGVGRFLAIELERCGFDVYESAFEGTDPGLATRQANIKRSKSDYSVSIHFNATGDGKSFNSAKGVEVYYSSNAKAVKDSKKFAALVLDELIKGTPQQNRRTKGAGFAMCKTSSMGTKASILVETAFMTNQHEAINLMGKSSFWKETAQDIARGICKYTNVSYIPE